MFQIAKQLKKVWELEEICRTFQVTRAVDSSPLTGLPGNRMIEKKVCECLEQNNDFSDVYVDIDKKGNAIFIQKQE